MKPIAARRKSSRLPSACGADWSPDQGGLVGIGSPGWRTLIASRPARFPILRCATFFAASGERVKRITAAFDWAGVVQAKNFRVDAWVTPPAYTARPPVILPVCPTIDLQPKPAC